MMLKICEENFLFYISHTKYMDILCYFVIFLCILLCILIQNKTVFNTKGKWTIIKKITVVVASLAFLLFLVLVFALSLNSAQSEGCSCAVTKKHLLSAGKSEYQLKDISLNKTIIIGDSRMELIERERDKQLEIPTNISFIAKGGAKIDWFKKTAVLELEKILENKNANYNYHVVMNMGVNDLDDVSIVSKQANDYFDIYRDLAIQFPDVKFYILSVNPVNDGLISDYWPDNHRTNKKIVNFNNWIIKKIKTYNFSNMTYCDSYNEVTFKTQDGLHYTKTTNQEIVDYITNKCVVY